MLMPVARSAPERRHRRQPGHSGSTQNQHKSGAAPGELLVRPAGRVGNCPKAACQLRSAEGSNGTAARSPSLTTALPARSEVRFRAAHVGGGDSSLRLTGRLGGKSS